MRVLARPIITEKTLRLAEEENQYTFEVNIDSNKIDVKKAVEEKFGVTVLNVTTLIRLGKKQTFGKRRIEGRKDTVKRAVITLKSGETIGVFKLK